MTHNALSFLSSSSQMFLFSIVQLIVSHLSTSVGQNMMCLLVGTGQVFKPSTRVDYNWNVFNIPHYLPSHFEAEIAVDTSSVLSSTGTIGAVA